MAKGFVEQLEARIKAIEEEKAKVELDQQLPPDKKKQLVGRAGEIIDKLKFLRDFATKDDFTEKDIREVMTFTCYDSLAFCCNLGEAGKPCFYRDSVLEALGISPEEFIRIKNEFTNRIIGEVMRKRGAKSA
jgi:hypothetical protein